LGFCLSRFESMGFGFFWGTAGFFSFFSCCFILCLTASTVFPFLICCDSTGLVPPFCWDGGVCPCFRGHPLSRIQIPYTPFGYGWLALPSPQFPKPITVPRRLVPILVFFSPPLPDRSFLLACLVFFLLLHKPPQHKLWYRPCP